MKNLFENMNIGLRNNGSKSPAFFRNPAPSSPSNPQEPTLLRVGDVMNDLVEGEMEKLVNEDDLMKSAIRNCEDNGIVVLDELDKLCHSTEFRGGGSKGDGVQKELLSLLEGTHS